MKIGWKVAIFVQILFLVVSNLYAKEQHSDRLRHIKSLQAVNNSPAKGFAKLYCYSSTQPSTTFQVALVNLLPTLKYQLVVNGISIATKQSDNEGTLEFLYKSKISPEDHEEAALLPNYLTSQTIHSIAIWTENNEPILVTNSFDIPEDDINPQVFIPDVTVVAGTTTNVTVNVTDPDGSPVTLSVKCNKGNFVSVTGLVLTIAPQRGDVGTTSCTVTATNAFNLSTSAGFNINVLTNNRPPMIGTVPDQRLRIGDTLRVTIPASDPDGDPLRVSLIGAPQAFRSIEFGSNGVIIVNFAATTLTDGGRVTVQVTDTQGLTAQTSFNLAIDNAVVISIVNISKPNLFISGSGFGSTTAKVMINGQDLSSKIIGQSDNSITLRGSKKRLNLKAGQNQVIVSVGGVASKPFIFSLLMPEINRD